MQARNVIVVVVLFGLFMTLGGPVIGASASDVTWSNSGPYVDRILYSFMDRDSSINALLNNEIDMISNFLYPEALDPLSTNPDVSVDSHLRNGYGQIAINCRDYPLNIGAFRRAFAFAFDKTRVTNEAWDGFSQEHDSLVPYPNPWCIEEEFTYHYYTEQSAIGNQLLDDAGFLIDSVSGFRNAPDGNPFDVYFEWPASSPQIAGPIAQIAIDALHSLHIDATAVASDFYEYLNRLYFHGEYDMVFYAQNFHSNDVDWLAFDYWSDYADTDYQNPTNFRNATYDSWRDQLLYGTTYEEVYEAAAEMQNILQYNVPLLVIYENTYLDAYRNDRFEGHVNDISVGIPGWWTNQKVQLMDSAGGPFGGTFRASLENEPSWFNILCSTSAWDLRILNELYDSLLNLAPDGADNSWLAESYLIETNSDNPSVPLGNTRFTFNLIDNATWSDGTPLTAHDVAFTINYVNDNAIAGYDFSQLSTAYAVGDYQFVAEFIGESFWYLHNVAFTPIVPEHIWQGIVDPMDYVPSWDELVTSGPFVISSYNPGVDMVLTKNMDFFYLPEDSPSLEIIDVEYDNSLMAYTDDGFSTDWTPGLLDAQSRWFFRGSRYIDLQVSSSTPIDLEGANTPWDEEDPYVWNDELVVEFTLESTLATDSGVEISRSSNTPILEPGMNTVTIGADVSIVANPIVDGIEHTTQSFWIGLFEPVWPGLEFNFLSPNHFWTAAGVGDYLSFETEAEVFNPYDYQIRWMPTITFNLFIEDTLYLQTDGSGPSPLSFQTIGSTGDVLDVTVSTFLNQPIELYPQAGNGDIWLWWEGHHQIYYSPDMNLPPEYLQFDYFNNQGDVNQQLIDGEVDLGNGFFGLNTPIDAVDTSRYEIESNWRSGYGHLVLNTDKYPLNITNLRRSIAFALDKWHISNEILPAYSVPLDCIIPGANNVYSIEGDLGYSYYDADLATANILLDEAGFIDLDSDGYREAPNGDSFSITIVTPSYEQSVVAASIGEFTAQACLSIGINCEFVREEFWTYLERVRTHGDFDIVFYATNFDIIEPEWLAQEYHSSVVEEYNWNGPNFNNATFDYYADLLLSSTSQEDALYYSDILQRIIVYQCPMIPVYENYQDVAYDSALENVYVSSIEGTTNLDTYYNLLGPYPFHQTVTSAVIAPRTFNPFSFERWNTGSEFNPLTLVYESLIRYDSSGNLIPWLAASYDVMLTESGCDIYIDLPTDKLWHDMEMITASDVAFTFDYMLTHGCPAFFDIVSLVDGVDVIDDSHLIIHLTDSSYFRQIDALRVPILPEHIWSNVANPYDYENGNPIGSGVFSFFSKDYADTSAYIHSDFFGWQMVTGAHPESGSVDTYEDGDYLIAVDYYSGDLPVSYTITIEYGTELVTLTGTIAEQDDLTIDYQPQYGFEMEHLYYVWLPAGQVVSMTVDWDTNADLDIYVWSPSELNIFELSQLTLRRWSPIDYQPPEFLEFIRAGIDFLYEGNADLYNGIIVDSNSIDASVFSILETQRNGYGHLIINCDKYPLNETAFRRALAFALDKDRISSEILDNNAVPVDSIIPQIYPFSIEGQFPYSYYSVNIEIANQLLDEAGFMIDPVTGFRNAPDGSPLSVLIETADSSQIAIDIGYLTEEALLSIGIKGICVETNFYDYLDRVESHGDFDIVFYAHNWNSYDNLDWIQEMFWSQYIDDYYLNPANFENATLDYWIEELMSATDYNSIETAAIEIQQIIAYECPWILTYQNIYEYAAPNLFNEAVINPVDGIACFDTYQNLLTPTPDYQTVITALPSLINLNPFHMDSWSYLVDESVARFNPLTLVYESLLRIDSSGITVPSLASTYNVDVVGGTCDIHVELQPNVLWHDLVPLTANDVAFTYAYMKEHQCPIFYDSLSLVTSVEIIDSTNLIIHLTSSSYWDQLAIMQVPILPMHIWENVIDPYAFVNENPIGSGPFMFVDSITNTYTGIAELDSSDWQMVTGDWPEYGTIITEESGDFLIGVDFYSGNLPMDYTITMTYDGFEKIIDGTITEDDIISANGGLPWSAIDMEMTHYANLPANTEVNIVVDWNVYGDLDIYMWSPSVIYTDLVDEISLQRWHDYYNSPHVLKSLETYVCITPSWSSTTDFSVYWRANGPYDVTDATVYWAYSPDNLAWTSWKLLDEFTPLSTYGAGYIDFNAIYGEGYYSFRIEATDVIGHTSSFEFYTGVDFQTPIADAGQDWIIQQWDYLTFDGFGSTDNIGIANYQWTFTDGDLVTLWGVNPTYQFTTDGTFEVTLTVTDNAGHQSIDSFMVIVVYDTAPPETTVTGPSSGSTVSDDTTYTIESDDETGVAMTEVYLDGELVLAQESDVVDYILDPTTIADGQHTLEIVVYDTFGQAQVTVYVVFTDTTPPEVQAYVPPECSGPTDFIVDATDETGIDRVEFWLDGVLRVVDYTDPYVFYVYTPDLVDGEHTLEIIVYDTVGNYRVEVRIFVVDNTSPELLDFSQDFYNGIPGWELTLTTTIVDFSSLSSVQAIVSSVDGYSIAIPMTHVGSGVYEAVWSSPTSLIGQFSIDIIATDALGNIGTYDDVGWVHLYDYISLTATRAELQLVDSFGNTINQSWNDFVDSYGMPLAYYTDYGESVEILLLSPSTDLYQITVEYLEGLEYTLSILATGEGVLIHEALYDGMAMNPGDSHRYLLRYNTTDLTADSEALPEMLVVAVTDSLYILPGDYLQCQLNWFNLDPGVAREVEIILEYSEYLEFVSCSYPVVINGDQLILDIGSVIGFSLEYVELTFYMVNLLACNGDELWVNATMNSHDDWFLFDYQSKDNQLITVVTQIPENIVQTSWWWKSEFTFALGSQESTYDLNYLQTLVTMISYSSELFSDVTTLEQALGVLILNDYKGLRGLALRELYGVWLNLANDALTSDTIIGLGKLTTAGTVGEAILECELILLADTASPQDLLGVMRICQEINAGRY